MLIPDLRELVDGKVEGKSVKVQCVMPDHDDDDPSMHVYAEGAQCFSCGVYLTQEAFVRLRFGLAEDADVAAVLADLPRIQRTVKRKLDVAGLVAESGALPDALATVYERCLHERADKLDWLWSRGLSTDTVVRARLGYNVFQYVIPVFYPKHGLVTLRYRADPAVLPPDVAKRRKYTGLSGRNIFMLYPLTLALPMMEKQRRVVFCEGEFDALRLIEENIPALAGTNGAGEMDKMIEALHTEFGDKRLDVWATPDADEAGDKAWRALQAAKWPKAYTLRGRVPLHGANDVTDLYKAGGKVEFDGNV